MIPIPVPDSKHGLFYVRCDYCNSQYRVTVKGTFGERCCPDCGRTYKPWMTNLTPRQAEALRKVTHG